LFKNNKKEIYSELEQNYEKIRVSGFKVNPHTLLGNLELLLKDLHYNADDFIVLSGLSCTYPELKGLSIHHASMAEVLPVQAFLPCPANLYAPKGEMITHSVLEHSVPGY